MIGGLLGKKLRMSRLVADTGAVVGTTLVSVGPCFVTQIKTPEKDGYAAVQLGYEEYSKLNKPQIGHLKAGPRLRYLREVPHDPGDELELGQKFDVSLFEPGEHVDVVATSKGRGFAGVVKRYNFRGGPKTHGQSDRWRAPGSIGAGTTPGRVVKGTRMAGRMGNERVTVRNIEVLAIDTERNLLALKGGVPGPTGVLVTIRKRTPRQRS
ncbi:MAG: large subunit ribosomal protein [Chloroflexota bacterium]|nr:large subunit ribosomal protein [Chloroflexota bacterium]